MLKLYGSLSCILSIFFSLFCENTIKKILFKKPYVKRKSVICMQIMYIRPKRVDIDEIVQKLFTNGQIGNEEREGYHFGREE